MKIRILIYPLLIMGFLLILANSCKKDTNKDVTITWANPADITVGTLLSATQLNATADVPGIFVYTPANGASLSVGANQDLKVDFTPTDLTTYNKTSKTVKINVIDTTFTDSRDGNVYQLVNIGTQIWMKENLRYLPSVVGPSTGGSSAPYYYVYDYNGTSVTDAKATVNYTAYGVLYNWHAAKNGCPTGWHLPSDAEWMNLITYLGGESVAGDKLKETSTTHWITPNFGSTNETGFTALPGGLRGVYGTFGHIGSEGGWWSATAVMTDLALYRVVNYNSSNVVSYGGSQEVGFSVRCLRD